MEHPLISVTSPVYRAAGTVPVLVSRIRDAVQSLTNDFEIILVDDGSPDGSWDAIVHECERDRRVKGLRLSRNFGQHAAITAALRHALGQYVVVMDCDLQDDPADIPRLYARALEGFDVVLARKRQRQFGIWKNLSARAYWSVLRLLSDVHYDANVGTFSLISRRVVEAFLQFGDYRRGYTMVLWWLGFERAHVEVEHRDRYEGRSTYSALRLLTLALSTTVTYTERPLHISIYAGLALSLVAIVSGIGLIIRYFTTNIGQMVLGWTSLIVSLFFLCGLILVSLGIIGLYLGRVFEQVKQRPIFVVGDARNMETADALTTSTFHKYSGLP